MGMRQHREMTLILAMLMTGGLAWGQTEKPDPVPLPGGGTDAVTTTTPPVPVTQTAPASTPATPAAETAAPPAAPEQEQPEALTRGPVNESFARPVQTDINDGVTTTTEPPAAAQETPPVERPANAATVWVPGYWAWDADRTDYIWVSGCWRVAPPHMTWVPGYWTPVPGGWRWVAGFWVSDGSREIDYLPAPPTLPDMTPVDVAPSSDVVWVPPCWYWRGGQYVLRPGYWLTVQPGWVWVPSHYTWSPRGHIFIAGHWDFPIESRGVIFAPLWVPPRARVAVGVHVAMAFTPNIVLDVNLLSANLFAYPRYGHYYFGDYYDDAYVKIGIYPWFDSVRVRGWYDPCFEYARWHHVRHDPHWVDHLRHDYGNRRDHPDLRPARSYHEMESRMSRIPEPDRRRQEWARPMDRVANDRANSGKFERVSPDARKQVSSQANDVHRFSDQRRQWESNSPSRSPSSGRNEDAHADDRVQMPSSPYGRQPGAPATPTGEDHRGRDNGGRDRNDNDNGNQGGRRGH
ncbi:MAG: YXWGXW repeat-containing protein [Phycisphaeraceae bacterium]|nr:YXWGXW repeat-containing protein [Phycisphaeraceae bacterium]